jgi:DNA (cytosine-5)-methyltransferase 1
MRNASHVSTFCSFLDLYRPEYGVLENVVSMAHERLPGQNVLSQVVACIVSMGYQVNQYIMDTWSYGSGQHRSRLFLTVAAPGLDPIAQPWHTHSRSYEDIMGKSLGRLPNGQRFGEREYYPTPFAQVTAAALTPDLPNIGNGNVLACIPFPDHRTVCQPGRIDRALLQCIPPERNYAGAFKLGLIPSSLHRTGRENGKGYARIKSTGLVPCITTGQSLQANQNGAIVHWSEDRPITLLEARRAQGWSDDQPIIGSLVEQYRIVGNGVDRKVSFALGLALRQVFDNKKPRKLASLPLRLLEEMLVDVDEEEEDTVYVSSNINVNVPGHSETVVQDETPTAATERPDAWGSSSMMSSTTGDISVVPGFDGAADVRDETPEPSQHVTYSLTHVPNGPSQLCWMLTDVANGLGEPALRANSNSLIFTFITTHGKRGREEESDAARRASTLDGDPARKRRRTESTTQSPAVEDRKTSIEDKLESVKLADSKIRSTRHSGLEVLYQPKQWDRRPEHEHATME